MEKGPKFRKLRAVLVWEDKVYEMGKINNWGDMVEKEEKVEKNNAPRHGFQIIYNSASMYQLYSRSNRT